MKQLSCVALGLVLSASVCAQSRLQGDVGLAIYDTPAIARKVEHSHALLPYVYADYGPFYARINTLGYKLTPMGMGHLEVATRITLEGYSSTQAGIARRAQPMPLGLGTFQKTPWGGVFVYDFVDPTSGGNLFDATYVAKLNWGGLSVYPQVGVERRSAKYVQHLYGVSASEATASQLASYNPTSSVNTVAGVTLQYPLNADYGLTVQWRKRWLDASMSDSPLVAVKSQTTSFVAISRSFN